MGKSYDSYPIALKQINSMDNIYYRYFVCIFVSHFSSLGLGLFVEMLLLTPRLFVVASFARASNGPLRADLRCSPVLCRRQDEAKQAARGRNGCSLSYETQEIAVRRSLPSRLLCKLKIPLFYNLLMRQMPY